MSTRRRRISPLRLLVRGLLLRCPYCGRSTFVRGPLRTNDRCHVCGLVFEHDDGFFLGALVFNYLITAALGIVPAVVLVARGTWSLWAALLFAVGMCLVLPVLFYWHAKSLWMAVFYCFVPEDLEPEGTVWEKTPANEPKSTEPRDEEDLREAIAALEGGRRPGRRE